MSLCHPVTLSSPCNPLFYLLVSGLFTRAQAAGLALHEWYRRRLGSDWQADAMKQLRRLQAKALAPENVREAARQLTTRVDFDHTLPFADDLIEDARQVIEYVAKDGV